MNHRQGINENDELQTEYDFSGGVRGKHFQAYRQGTNLVPLDEDVAQMFPDASAVNEALRLLIKLAKQRVPPSHTAEP